MRQIRRFIQWLFRIYPDQFRLDVARIIEIDGREFETLGFTVSQGSTTKEEITITFARWKKPGEPWGER